MPCAVEEMTTRTLAVVEAMTRTLVAEEAGCAYNEVNTFMWPPMSLWEEMSTKGALFAVVNIFDKLAMIDKTPNGQYNRNPSANKRHLIQMGDVTMIKNGIV